jgi:hypothetical protein
MNIKIEGMENLNKILQNIPGKARQATAEQLRNDLSNLKSEAQKLTPVNTGDLQGTARSGADEHKNGVAGYVSFDTPYATRQHEEVWYKHPKGGQAKYLETPLKANLSKYVENISRAIKKAVDK